ncbi:MAG: sensor domain-containing diguanylate cyclase [Bacillota bacterium]|nr:sensor domain-containing diguanylate cyclase [Bacillota bacterium]
MDSKTVAEGLENGVGQFETELPIDVEDASPLFDLSAYPENQHDLLAECNRRIAEANHKYRIARFREDMFAKGLKAGMFFCTFDRDENLLSFEFNDETRKMLGYDGLEDLPDEFDSWVKTLVPEEREAIVKLFWDSVHVHRELPEITHATYRMQKKDGSIIWITGAGRFIRRPDDGSLEIYMGCYRDITAQQKKISDFEAEIYFNSLSRVRNRRFLDEKVIGKPCHAVVMADIDLFKQINDTAGHQRGDEFIQKVAELLNRSVRKEDVVLRYGGDEFMMVFFDITRKDLEAKLSYLQSEVKKITFEKEPEVHITMSFGGAFGIDMVYNLIGIADKALYESKKKRDSYTVIET